jgi:pilus assembly protein CpaE
VITTAIICPDSDVRSQLLEKIAEHGRVYVVRKFEHYPYESELAKFLQAAAPDVVFVSLESLDRATYVCSEIEEHSRGTQVIAVHRNCDVNILLNIMHRGVRQFLTLPLETEKFRDALAQSSQLIKRHVEDPSQEGEIFSFLPAKPGSGASTVAVNTAAALARRPDSRVLLLDFDLNSGTIRYQLQPDGVKTISEAAEKASQMDENLWPEFVSKNHGVHLLPTGKLDPGAWLEPIRVGHLINFSRRMYDHVLIDHSGNMEKYSVELLRSSKRIFLVCEADTLSLRLARQKIEFLRDQDLAHNFTVVLNRTRRECTMPVSEVEEAIESKVGQVIPYDRTAIQAALKERRPVEERSDFGKACEELARLVQRPVVVPAQKKRFIQFFRLSRASA